jgi:hypothetical protein
MVAAPREARLLGADDLPLEVRLGLELAASPRPAKLPIRFVPGQMSS